MTLRVICRHAQLKTACLLPLIRASGRPSVKGHSGSYSILVATGERWLRWSFGQPGLPQSFFVSQKVFGPLKRAQHVFESGNA
jgi:hypothetical protein